MLITAQQEADHELDNEEEMLQENPESPDLEPAAWSLSDPIAGKLNEWQEIKESNSSTISADYDGQSMAEFDVEDWVESQVDIDGAGRPRHWLYDLFSPEDRLKQYTECFRDMAKHLYKTREDLKKLVINCSDDSMLEAIIKSGRPAGWSITFVTWGEAADGSSRDMNENNDYSDALKWLGQGGHVEIIFNKLDPPLKTIGYDAIKLFG